MEERPIIVAIDGPGGVGKSTVAKAVARHLQIPYLETGAMYRALGLKVLEEEIDPEDEERVVEVANQLDLTIAARPDGSAEILLDREPLGTRVRDESVARITSKVAAFPEVRRRLVDLQRSFGSQVGGVVEGRDIGSRVFPETPFKFFLEADPQIRAERRLGEHRSRGRADASIEELRREMEERDRRDSERSESPLRKDASYQTIDTSRMTVEQVSARVIEEVERLRGESSSSDPESSFAE